jgi:dihydroxyacetone kinase-like protein
MSLTSKEFTFIFMQIALKIEEQKDYLSELDRQIGDGDHGVSMSIGWTAVRHKLEELANESDIGVILQAVSRTFLNAVGASVGPLYGSAFLRGSAVAKGKSELNQEDIVKFWTAAVGGIKQLGKAQVGDKTMVDTWEPIAASLEASLQQGEAWEAALDKAVLCGEQGMNSTKELLSQKGRSGRLGERSKGHIDPGAVSAYLIFSTFVSAYKALKATA